MSDRQKTIVVTGGTRGIGRAVCLLAAERGYDVCFNYRTGSEAAQELVSAIEHKGRRGLAVAADLSDPSGVDLLFEAVDRFGGLTGLVNNAGITGRTGSFLSTSAQTIREVFEINVFSLMECCRRAALRMATSRGGNGGAIVNVSSGAARTGSPNTYVWYGASKAAVDTFTAGLAAEVAGDGVRVNALSPGVTDTGIHASGVRADFDKVLATIPLGRMATPNEIAEPILWLLSDQASYVTGAVLRAGGGRL
ncbi:SDR family oxidoreductase [Pararhizobium haloflavum]|uniref:SDR family oxidoreductase n=1 Tax=Pararhizobium haloflavum TaxID=2037914 RepID=UPI000C1790DE|nr:SDR family oxidoreductase [Pararhizobium haloflavum]